MSAPSLVAQCVGFAHYAQALRRYLATPLPAGAWRAQLSADLAARAGHFLRLVEHGVYARPESPYRRLLEHAGIGLGDLAALVRRRGVEEALGTLFDAGVRLHVNEFKGRVPIRRGSLCFEASSHDFDNPLSARHLVASTGGSRGAGTPILMDLENYARDALYEQQTAAAFGYAGRPHALWLALPPWTSGLKGALMYAKLGEPPHRWITPGGTGIGGRTWRHDLLTRYTVLASRWHGQPVPAPEAVPFDEAWRVAEWLAAKTRAGTPALLSTNTASIVRACAAAAERGLDIAGTVFRGIGEPLTPAKHRIALAAGCRTISVYSTGEAGRLGQPCAAPAAIDDSHVLTDKLALLQRPHALPDGTVIDVNVYTTLLPITPKLMLNVEIGDCGVLERRRCGCPFGELGFDLHLHTVHSYEKLTSEGMNFLGHDLIQLIEEVLPARFGGQPTDYQLVEREEDGLTRIALVVSPHVAGLDEAAAVDAVVGFLNRTPGASGDYGELWRRARTLSVVRREPHATLAGKVSPLHVLPQEPARQAATGARRAS